MSNSWNDLHGLKSLEAFGHFCSVRKWICLASVWLIKVYFAAFLYESEELFSCCMGTKQKKLEKTTTFIDLYIYFWLRQALLLLLLIVQVGDLKKELLTVSIKLCHVTHRRPLVPQTWFILQITQHFLIYDVYRHSALMRKDCNLKSSFFFLDHGFILAIKFYTMVS